MLLGRVTRPGAAIVGAFFRGRAVSRLTFAVNFGLPTVLAGLRPQGRHETAP